MPFYVKGVTFGPIVIFYTCHTRGKWKSVVVDFRKILPRLLFIQNQSIHKTTLAWWLDITLLMLVKGYCNTTFYFPIIYSSNSCHTIFRFCFFPARYDKKEIYCNLLRLVVVLQFVFRYLPFTFRPLNTRLRLLQKSSLLLFPLIFFILINIFSDV